RPHRQHSAPSSVVSRQPGAPAGAESGVHDTVSRRTVGGGSRAAASRGESTLMGARDLIVTIGRLGSVPVCVLRPWIGILVWSLVSYMNPHRLTFGFAYDFPFAQIIAVATLIGFVFTSERKPFMWTREIFLVVLMGVWFTITTMFAVYPESAWTKW